MGGSDVEPTMLHSLAGDGKLDQVVSNHLRLVFRLVEGRAVAEAH